MDYKDFMKKVHSVVLKENRGVLKLTSKEKRDERRENRFKNARVKERNTNQARRVREMRAQLEAENKIKLASFAPSCPPRQEVE